MAPSYVFWCTNEFPPCTISNWVGSILANAINCLTISSKTNLLQEYLINNLFITTFHSIQLSWNRLQLHQIYLCECSESNANIWPKVGFVSTNHMFWNKILVKVSLHHNPHLEALTCLFFPLKCGIRECVPSYSFCYFGSIIVIWGFIKKHCNQKNKGVEEKYKKIKK